MKNHRNFAMACAMFMNSQSMPIALIQSLIGSVPDLKWNDSDTVADMQGRALVYLVVYSTLGNIARWSFGVKVLEKADEGAEEAAAEEKKAKDIEAAAAVPTISRPPSRDSHIPL